MNANDHDPQHELLCAYVLGEATPEQNQQMEAALAGSPDLRAQRDQLAATIALVGRNLGDHEHLSEGALASLIEAAGAPPVRRPWHASPALRVAAALLVTIGGTLGLMAPGRNWATGEQDFLMGAAQAPESSPESDTRGLSGPVDHLKEFGYADGESEVVAAITVGGGEGTALNGPLDEGRRERSLSKDLTREEYIAFAGAIESSRKEEARLYRRYAVEVQDLGLLDVSSGAKREAGRGLHDKDPAAPAGPTSPGPGKKSADTIGLERVRMVTGSARPPTESGPGAGGGGASVIRLSSDEKGKPRFRAFTTADASTDTAVIDPDTEVAANGGFDPSTVTREVENYYLSLSALGYSGEAAGETADDELASVMSSRLRGMGYGVEADDGFESLSEEELAKRADRISRRIYQDCRRRPQESPRDMFFRFWGDNPFIPASSDPLSTFAADVDTASYALARRYLEEGRLPTKAQIRTEEFVNYAAPDLPAPTESALAIHTELAPSLFGADKNRWMLRVGIRGQEVAPAERKSLALTFAIDVSGSMKEGRRLELVKHAIRLLVGQLRAGDQVALVAYSTEARVILPMTDATQRSLIESALHPLSPNGGTNAEAGLKVAYELALAGLNAEAHNRVILLSDGVANIGVTDQDRINADVARHRAAGIYLNTIGVGMNNHNDVFLEQLANKGDGICDYVDDEAAVQRAIVERFTGALIPIAGDVKIQVQFDPAQVGRYRLLGYENRAVADADFRNDAVDAGEIGAGHQVVALYELDLISDAGDGPLATVRLRWKAPKIARQHPLEVDVTETSADVNLSSAVASFDKASPGYRRSVLTAQLAEFLRRSSHARGDSFRVLDDQCTLLAREQGDPDSVELSNLVKRSIGLGLHLELRDRTGVGLALEEYRRYLHMRAQIDDLEGPDRRLNSNELEDLRRRNDELEKRVRDMIFEDLLKRNG